MLKDKVFKHVKDVYEILPDYPFKDENAVFRHKHNKKWFALVMEISLNKLIPNASGKVNVINLKSDPLLTSSLGDKGIYPAYHMSKTKWISVLLDGSVDFDMVKVLIDASFTLTE